MDDQPGPTSGPHPLVADAVVELRPWRRDDAAFLAQALADPEIRRYNGDHDRHGRPAPPPSVSDAELIIERFATTWRGFAATRNPSGIAFAVVDKSMGQPVGCCGVDDWTGEDVAQIGYWLAPQARGHGYATRAVIALTRWLFELGAARVFLTVAAGNEGSAAVARRAGFVHEGTMRSHGIWQGRRYDVGWFGAVRSDWPSP